MIRLVMACVASTLLLPGCDVAPSSAPVADTLQEGPLTPVAAATPSSMAEALTPESGTDAEGVTDDLPNLMDAEVSSERAMQLTLPRADHPTWNRLRTTRVAVDEATQLYTASHTADVRALAGTTLTLRGYMLPLETAARTTHFLVSPYTPVCFFHPPAEPNEVIEVHAANPIEAGYHLVEVTGTFRLSDDGEKGLFFQLDDTRARVVERVTG